MKKTMLTLLLVLPIFLSAQSKSLEKKVLMVVSSYGKDKGAVRPGYEFDEFSQAYHIFKNNGLAIDVASPKGGAVEADAYNEEKTYNQLLLKDPAALQLLEHTKATADVSPQDYDAIYIVGGKGAMFDLPFDPSLQDIVLHLYKQPGAVIASVCHGPASFVNIKNKNEYIIKDVEMTGFCNAEEALFGKKWVGEFPFSLEDKLIARGAKFQQADFMLSKIAISDKFITGQNPFSTTGSAEAVVRALGMTPVKRNLYKDEKSVYLIQDILEGHKTKTWAEKELAKHTDSYDIQIMAVYGYYKLMAANDDPSELAKSVALIELTTPHFFNENLQYALAKTYITLNETDKARTVLNTLVSKNLLKEQAEALLKTL